MAKTPYRLLERKGDATWFIILIAGGPADIFREVAHRLSERKAICAKYHWEYQTNAFNGVIPNDVHFVLMLKDFIGHSDHEALKNACRKANVPIVTTSSKWAMMKNALEQHGIVDNYTQGQAITLFASLSTAKQQELMGITLKEPEPEKFSLAPIAPMQPTVLQAPIEFFRDIPLADLVQMMRDKLSLEGLKRIYLTTESKTFEVE